VKSAQTGSLDGDHGQRISIRDYPESRAGSTIKFAQSKFKREMVVLKGCSASEAGTNPPRRSVDPIAIIHS
jgi:hypothetical protein